MQRGRLAALNSGPPGGLELGAAWRRTSGAAESLKSGRVFLTAGQLFLNTGQRVGAQAARLGEQAVPSMQWYNYVSEQVPPGTQVLRLNLDETSVCLFQGGVKGNVFVTKGMRARQRVPLWKRRCFLTHVAIICDQPQIQPRLTQFIVGNWVALPQRLMPELRDACPPNVLLMRRRSAWLDQHLCAMIIRMLGRVLAAQAPGYQPVLILDAARIHCTRKVLLAANAAGIRLVLVPAKLTWLLQPLDVYGLAVWKRRLEQLYQEARIREGVGDLPLATFLQCIYDTTRQVLQGTRWAPAFAGCGYGARQTQVSEHVRTSLGVDGRLRVPATRPTLDDLALCFPRRTRVLPLASVLWAPFQARQPAATGAAGASTASASSSAAPSTTLA